MTDKQLQKFCLDFRKGILNGESSKWMCFAISAPLETLLNMNGCSAKLVEGTVFEDGMEICHVWLELPGGKIIDATADQFNEDLGINMPPVFIGEKPGYYLTN